jgi:predicted Rossmann-fold nucleotide-binding protein
VTLSVCVFCSSANGLPEEYRQAARDLGAELAGRGVALWLGNVRAGAREVLRRSGLAAAVGEARLYRTLADAAPDLHAALDA